MEDVKQKAFFKNMPIHIVFILACLTCVLPVLLVLAVSVSREKDILINGYSLIPQHITLRAYEVIFSNPNQILNAYAVTAAVAVCGTVIGMMLITSFAYVITRDYYKYRNMLSFYVFFTMLFNGGLVPNYILVSKWLGMRNTLLALIAPYLVSAFYILLMKGFLQSLPKSLFESAKIDGASESRILVSIVMPLAKPALATVSLFYVLQYWNDWYLCMLYNTETAKLFSLQYLLIRTLRDLQFLNSNIVNQALGGKFTDDIPTLTTQMAMCILAAGPMLFVFPFFQKYFVKGLTVGSVKG